MGQERGAPSRQPFPHPLAGQARTYASHTSFSTAARGFACKKSCHSRDQEWGRTWGRGRVGCFEGKRATQRWAVG